MQDAKTKVEKILSETIEEMIRSPGTVGHTLMNMSACKEDELRSKLGRFLYVTYQAIGQLSARRVGKLLLLEEQKENGYTKQLVQMTVEALEYDDKWAFMSDLLVDVLTVEEGSD